MQATQQIADLKSIQRLIVAKRFDDALVELGDLLRDEPNNQEALYMTAVCQRYQRQFDAALESLGRLKSMAPEHGRAHQE
ncbi:MAG: tetratricopeptide repeat protein, partial [Gammaproteobacteria bacterium]|nr:tetratricopeptide repeat protein [Gammaproteobacteria bacterium]